MTEQSPESTEPVEADTPEAPVPVDAPPTQVNPEPTPTQAGKTDNILGQDYDVTPESGYRRAPRN